METGAEHYGRRHLRARATQSCHHRPNAQTSDPEGEPRMSLYDPSPSGLFAPTVRKPGPVPSAYGGAAYGPSVAPSASPYATATPFPSIAIGSGYTPNYEQLIKTDPGYVSAMSGSQLDVNQ